MSTSDWENLEHVLQKLTPTEKLELFQRLVHSLRPVPSQVSVAKQQEAIRKLYGKLAALPVENPADGFSARDHDKLLYGASS